MNADVQERCARIKLLLMDCDGVLTDGRIWLFENGEEQKGFHTRDGLGIDLWHRAGFKSGIISGRRSNVVERRARELRMSFVCQGCGDKQEAYGETLAEAGLSSEEVAYVGDDLNDIALMTRSGLGVAVADAAPEARERAQYVPKAAGGQGAIREVVELILKAQGRWEESVKGFLTA
jgi:3-deoxy-D-manno-octulosonate 8-phosphate phosphatase (KDO 8-P phosphatase)